MTDLLVLALMMAMCWVMGFSIGRLLATPVVLKGDGEPVHPGRMYELDGEPVRLADVLSPGDLEYVIVRQLEPLTGSAHAHRVSFPPGDQAVAIITFGSQGLTQWRSKVIFMPLGAFLARAKPLEAS